MFFNFINIIIYISYTSKDDYKININIKNIFDFRFSI